MNDKQGTASQNPPVRVDLTSQDLRTGTIRLPRQLIGKAQEGELEAVDTATGNKHLLTVIEPRELHGLEEFFIRHELRTNDAIMLQFESGAVQLEPYYRSRRRSEVRTSTSGGKRTAQPAAAENATADLKIEAAATSNRPVELEEAESEEPPGSTAADTPADDQQHEAPIPSSEYTDFDDFDTFADLGELDPLDLTNDSVGPPDDDPQVNDVAPPALSHGEPTGRADADSTEQPRATDRDRHVVSRRPFNVTVSETATPGSAERQSAPAASTTLDQVSSKNHEETAATPQVTPTGASKVRAHLRKPGLPSILNAKDLAGQLDMQEEETAAVLAELSRESDSRLSQIRPGYWLLKQQEDGA